MAADAYNTGVALEARIGPEKSAQLRSCLLQGMKVPTLIRKIKDEWGLLPELKDSTVQTMLYRFGRGVVKVETAQRVMKTIASCKHVKVTTLEEIGFLIEKQKKRLEKALAMEEKTPLLLDSTRKEMLLLKDLLRDLAYLQIETGILPRVPKTVQGMLVGGDGKTALFSWQLSDDDLLRGLRLEAEERGSTEDTLTIEGETDDGLSL